MVVVNSAVILNPGELRRGVDGGRKDEWFQLRSNCIALQRIGQKVEEFAMGGIKYR